jgi:hypothetical protein
MEHEFIFSGKPRYVPPSDEVFRIDEGTELFLYCLQRRKVIPYRRRSLRRPEVGNIPIAKRPCGDLKRIDVTGFEKAEIWGTFIDVL